MRTAGSRCFLLLGVLLVIGCDGFISKEAASLFRARTEPVSVLVYPVQVARGPEIEYDATLAEQVATFFESEALAVAEVAEVPIEIPLAWRRNQARMASDAAAAFGAQVANRKRDSDYALFLQVLFNPDETEVLGVHYFLADRAGRMASGALLNEHHRELWRPEPRTRDDAVLVLQRVLRVDFQS